MTKQQSPRPVDEFAAAIYASVRLDENTEVEALVLQYRDKLTELAALRERHDQFVAVCAGRPPAAPSRETDGELTTLFREARAILCGEQLAVLEMVEMHRHLDHQIRRLCQHLAKTFFHRLEAELDAGRVGQFHSFSTKMGRCTLPVNARGRQFDSPLAMMLSVNEDDTSGDERLASSVIEFFIDQDVPLAGDRRLIRRFRPLQLIAEQATPPIRQFLRFISGTRYRQTDDLAHGRFTAIVFFHYVVDSWDDEALRSPARAPESRSRPRARISWNEVSKHIAVALVVNAICSVLFFMHHDHQQQAQITELKQRVAQLDSAPAPAIALRDHEQEFTELLNQVLPSIDLFANKKLADRFASSDSRLDMARAEPKVNPVPDWPPEPSARPADVRKYAQDHAEQRLSLVERRILAIHSRLDTFASRDDLEKLRTECLSKLKSIPSAPSTAAANVEMRGQLAAFTHEATGTDSPVELDSKMLAKAIRVALRYGLEMPPFIERRMASIRRSYRSDSYNSTECVKEIEGHATVICNELINVSAVFNDVVLLEKQLHKGSLKK